MTFMAIGFQVTMAFWLLLVMNSGPMSLSDTFFTFTSFSLIPFIARARPSRKCETLPSTRPMVMPLSPAKVLIPRVSRRSPPLEKSPTIIMVVSTPPAAGMSSASMFVIVQASTVFPVYISTVGM